MKLKTNYVEQFINKTAEPEHSPCPLVETGCITSLFIVYRYDSTTGSFTVPPGGDGFYYFSAYLRADGDKSAVFDIEVNGELVCSPYSDLTESSALDTESTSCSGVTYAVEGIDQSLIAGQTYRNFSIKIASSAIFS